MWYSIVMTEADKKKVAEIMEKHGVVVGYLFGSAVRGTMGPHSDIDTAVLFDEEMTEQKEYDRKVTLSLEIANNLHVPDADVINLKTARGPLIKYQAIFSGEVILEKDKDKRLALERQIVREYEDTRMLRKIRDDILREELKDGVLEK